LAKHHYTTALNMLPNTGWPDSAAGYPTDYSPLAKLLPYCEQENLQNLIDFSVHPGGKFGLGYFGNADRLRRVAGVVVPFFFCPSDPEAYLHDAVSNSVAVSFAGTNYAYNGGPGTSSDMNMATSTDKGGISWVGARLDFRDIKDGTSYTLAFTESLRGPANTPSRTPTPDVQVYGAAPCSIALAETAEAGGLDAMLPSVTGWNGTRLLQWLESGLPTGPFMNGRFPPNAPWPDLFYLSAKLTAARSRHPGGVNCGLCDGSVHFIADSIHVTAWRAFWTRDGGEVLSGSAH